MDNEKGKVDAFHFNYASFEEMTNGAKENKKTKLSEKRTAPLTPEMNKASKKIYERVLTYAQNKVENLTDSDFEYFDKIQQEYFPQDSNLFVRKDNSFKEKLHKKRPQDLNGKIKSIGRILGSLARKRV